MFVAYLWWFQSSWFHFQLWVCLTSLGTRRSFPHSWPLHVYSWPCQTYAPRAPHLWLSSPVVFVSLTSSRNFPRRTFTHFRFLPHAPGKRPVIRSWSRTDVLSPQPAVHFICLLPPLVIFPFLYCPQIVSFKYLSAFVVNTASNEVWGKVIFSQVCVITSVDGG